MEKAGKVLADAEVTYEINVMSAHRNPNEVAEYCRNARGRGLRVTFGFVSGVELTHPDKGTEMFLYELGVDDRYRRRGIGRGLVAALADRARERGCYGMWVLTDADNDAALRTYRSAGGGEPEETVMLTWELNPPG